jgi:two-component system sensor histidine kinase YesM
MILSKGKDSITLAEELELIKKYVFLAEISHSKHYELSIDADPCMNDIIIPHMLLQPFVENSIIHGLSGSRESCRILIKARFEDDFAVFTVFDNGYGMNSEMLANMNSLSKNSTSYGIKNTHERMQLKYGQAFSISYKSEFDHFTEATIKIQKSALLSEET